MTDGTVSDDLSSPRWIRTSSLIEERLNVLPAGGVLSIDLNGTEVLGAPYVQVLRILDGDAFLAEFSSNEFLGATFRMTRQQAKVMNDLGWNAPDSLRLEAANPNFHLSVESRNARDLAKLIARSFREVYPRIDPETLVYMIAIVAP